MKKKTYKEFAPGGKWVRVPDFLPPPEKLFAPDGTAKVTLILTKESIDFFKKQAQKNGKKYQKMIREVVDRYAKHFKEFDKVEISGKLTCKN